jgi:predicted RNase H-like HicB family nuclease
MTYTIDAEWDAEAGVWLASSPDVPGLATGAESLDALVEKLRIVVPDLLSANNLSDDASFNVVAHNVEQPPDAA